MLVLINGLPHFSEKIAKDLNEFDSNNKFVFYNTYESTWAQLRFLLALPFCGAVISFNGASDQSSSLDWVLRFKKKLIMQWHGTDVLLAVERNRSGTINRKYIDYAKHLASAPWFIDELKEVVTDIGYCPFGYVESVGNEANYNDVSVLSYVSKNRESFYGWDEIYEASKLLPNTQFTIVGSNGEGLPSAKNITFKGWVTESNLNKLMEEHAIFVRLTEHDGKAITVSKALAKGCEVIWTYPYECCELVKKDSIELKESIEFLSKQIKGRNFKPNNENIKFAKTSLLKNLVLSNYSSMLTELLKDDIR